MRPVSSRFFGGVGEEDLAGDGEGLGVLKTVEERLQELALDAHVAVEQDNDVVLGFAEACVGASTEA